MIEPLLATKLHVPRTRANLISRRRLLDRLKQGLELSHKLMLISAPPGYGKTTLVSDWIAGAGLPTAWLSLDEGDNDPVRFWTYLIAALQRVDIRLGQGIPEVLRSPQRPPTEALVTWLINELDALSHDLIIVLDDYHLITTAEIHEALALLLDHLPDNVHLILAARADPPLPVARLRGRGRLTEIRQADLRFTPEEAATFLESISNLDLSSDDIATLEERTEGWITGLQLAALSVQGRDDIAGFMSAFAGSHRYILDYLAEEVLDRQPEEIRCFLLQTSILDRLSGPLCDAVLRTGDQERHGEDAGLAPGPFTSSKAVLEQLESANLFAVPLDDVRTWYRYHRLFADLLRARLGEQYPERVPGLHRRASAWYEQEGLLDEAIKHAAASGDPALAARILETHGRSLLFRGELGTLLRWFTALPEEQIEVSARNCVTHAWALLLAGQLEGVEPRLRQAEELSAPDSPLLGDVTAIRAYVAAQRGDIARMIELGEQALQKLPATKQGERAVVHFTLGGARLLAGDLGSAADAFNQAANVGQQGGNLHVALPALNSLAGVQTSMGRLREAEATAKEAIALASGTSAQPLPIAAGAVSTLADLAYEWNRLDEALAYARQSVELGRSWGNADTLASSYLTLATVLLALGRPDAAREALFDAERLARDISLFPHFSVYLETTRTRLWLAEGNLAAARRWAADVASVPVFKDLLQALALAQVQLALGQADDALECLAGIPELARSQGLVSSLIRALSLEALAHGALGHKGRALGPLAEALALAEPAGYVRSFVDLGPAMMLLLREARAQGIALDYVGELLAALGADDEVPPAQAQLLIEPLSAREAEVLGLVVEGLSNREVGRRLHIAESTVKSHLNTIYGKLGVDNRTQASAKARTLGLV